MPADPDRAYAKKHKINDLLNELYLELTKKKPESPIEFAIKHLEAKLPPKEPSQVSFKVDSSQAEPAKDLFKTLLNQNEIKSKNSNFVSPISTFNILNKINQSIVKANKELTNEEILEKENIIYQPKHEEENFDTSTKAVISYKNDLKNRKQMDQHKEDIKRLVESQLFDDSKVGEQQTEQKPETYSDELMHEIISADNLYHAIEKAPKKKKQKLRPVKSNVDLAAPLIRFIVCQFCSKIQDKLNEENVIDKLINDDGIVGKDEKAQNVAEEKNIFDFFPRASVAKEENLDDEIIESASQVSGPRKIEPFEAQSSRTDDQYVDDGNQNILAWVMKNKLRNEIKIETKSELTLTGSKTGKKEASPKPGSRQSSAAPAKKGSNGSNLSVKSENYDSSKQQWRVNSQSSNSYLSGLKK